MLGLYCDRPSPIHRLPAELKLLALAIASMALFFVPSLTGLWCAAGVAIGLVAIARLPPSLVWQQLRPMWGLLMAIVLAHAVLTHWQIGLAIALRFATLLTLALVVSLTTRVSAMLTSLERSLAPLRRLGISPAQVSLVLAIAIRFIPVLLDQLQQIQSAQQARGCDRNLLQLLPSLLIRVLHLANDLSDAIEARGYDPNDTPNE
jgi:biotin transport system permease protein